MDGKRGFGHVEAIMAFVIFIAFLVFAFTFFSPFQSGRTLTSSLDYVWREVADATKIDLEIYSVYINNAVAFSPVTISIPSAPVGMNASVEDSQGNNIASYTDSAGVHFQKPIDNFVRVKFAEDFVKGSPISGTLLRNSDYSVSSSEIQKIFSEKKILDLNDSYYSNYSTLRTRFNLPNRVNFGFAVKISSSVESVSSKQIPENVEVLSENDRVAIVRIPSGVIEFADVRVFVW